MANPFFENLLPVLEHLERREERRHARDIATQQLQLSKDEAAALKAYRERQAKLAEETFGFSKTQAEREGKREAAKAIAGGLFERARPIDMPIPTPGGGGISGVTQVPDPRAVDFGTGEGLIPVSPETRFKREAGAKRAAHVEDVKTQYDITKDFISKNEELFKRNPDKAAELLAGVYSSKGIEFGPKLNDMQDYALFQAYLNPDKSQRKEAEKVLSRIEQINKSRASAYGMLSFGARERAQSEGARLYQTVYDDLLKVYPTGEIPQDVLERAIELKANELKISPDSLTEAVNFAKTAVRKTPQGKKSFLDTLLGPGGSSPSRPVGPGPEVR